MLSTDRVTLSRAEITAVLLLFLKLSMRKYLFMLGAAAGYFICTLSPSRNPASTKSTVVSSSVAEVKVLEQVICVLNALALSSILKLFATTKVFSAIDPTPAKAFAMYTWSPFACSSAEILSSS